MSGQEDEPYKQQFYSQLVQKKKEATLPFWEARTGHTALSQVLDEKAGAAEPKKHSGLNLLTAVTCCHDIWKSKQYNTPEWKPLIYQSVYTKDFKKKYKIS